MVRLVDRKFHFRTLLSVNVLLFDNKWDIYEQLAQVFMLFGLPNDTELF